jgi:uncharacterized protein with ParB-like and HNH nuclease domain
MMHNIQRTTFKVSDFINWYKYGSLVLSPKFQRRSVWNNGAKSFLIDTIVKGLPIPVLILRDVKTNIQSFDAKKEVVDGQQRLRTIISYVAHELIPDEESFTVKTIHNKLIGGKQFTKIDDSIKQRILDYEFFVHVLSSNVSDREILEIFSRMNSTGIKLNEQELRNAEFYGEFKTVVYNTALEYYDFWINSGILTEAKISRMMEVEIMNDLFTITMSGIIDRSPASITKYYSDFEENDSMTNKQEILSRVKYCLNILSDNLSQDIKQTIFRKNQLFYSLFAVIYDLTYGINSKLSKATANKISIDKLKMLLPKLSEKLANNQNIPDKVFISLTKGTNRKNARILLFNFLKKEIQNGIK